MKSNILLLLADFYPNPSPNTTCIMPLIKELAKEHHIDIVTSNTGSIEGLTFPDNIELHRIIDKKMINHFKWLRRIENQKNRAAKKFLTYCSYASKLVHVMVYNDGTDERGYIGWNKSRVEETICGLLESKQIDYVISVSHPFKTHDIVYGLREKYDFKWYMLEFDAFGINNFLFKEEESAARIKKESRYFERADRILLTPQLYKAYLNNEYSRFADKFYKLEFCNLYQPVLASDKQDFNDKSRTSLFYAGAFNLYIRNPKRILEFLSGTKKDYLFKIVTKCHLRFAQSQIDAMGNRLEILPRQRFDDVYYTECQADFNVSIGNSIDYQSPGKTLELISTGRPIIHFAQIPTDPVPLYFVNYPNVLVVKLYEPWEEQSKNFDEFISQRFETMPFEEIVKSNPEMNPDIIKKNFTELF